MNDRYNKIQLLSIVVLTAVISSFVTYVFGPTRAVVDERHGIYFDEEAVSKEDIEKFRQVWDILTAHYYYGADESKMFEGAIAGLAYGLKEPYTVYYNQEQMALLMDEAAALYVGVGLIVRENEEGLLEVIESIVDGPAYHAGVKKGDMIVRVDGDDVTMVDRDIIVARVRGEEGTKVTITFFRPETRQYEEFEMKREKVHLPSVRTEIIEPGILYLRITMFDKLLMQDLAREMRVLSDETIHGIVLDLRDNPGGSYDQVMGVADMFLPEGVIMYTEDKAGRRKYERSGESHIDWPMVVMVNSYSASGSEVLAGAFQDHQRAPVVGTVTVGKGLVQSIIPLVDGSGLKVTTAGYFTPSGQSVQDVGIIPDHIVEMSDDYINYPISALPREEDTQLHKALELLLRMIESD